MYPLDQIIAFHARVRPAAPFLLLGNRHLTYRGVAQLVDQTRAVFADAGVRLGDRVAISCLRTEDYVASIFACWGLDATAVPIDSRADEERTRTYLAGARAHWLVRGGSPDGRPLSIERTAAPDDRPWFEGSLPPAEMLFTSGSSGLPKAAVLRRDTLLAAAIESCDSIDLKPSDVQLTTVPFWHAYGQNRGLLSTAYAGASVRLLEDEQISARIAALKQIDPTVLVSMPNFYALLCYAKQRPGARLRVALSGAAPLPEGTQRAFEELFGIPLLTTYGLTECQVGTCQRLDAPRPPGSVGYPIRGVRLRLVDDEGRDVQPGAAGVILLKGHNIMVGYFGGEETSISPDGWLNTQDVGRLDEHGALHLLGRQSAFVKKLGYKVYPVEIQNALMTHPEVVEVAVQKFVSAAGLEELAAAVVLRQGSTVTARQLQAHCAGRLESYKVPARCVVVERIEKLPSGKPSMAASPASSGHQP